MARGILTISIGTAPWGARCGRGVWAMGSMHLAAFDPGGTTL